VEETNNSFDMVTPVSARVAEDDRFRASGTGG
jgi:hypothetical protein